MEAACSKNLACVRALLEAGADPNVQDNDGETALMDAALMQSLVCMRALLEAGADPTIGCYEGGTVSGILAQSTDPSMEALLRMYSVRGELLRRVWRSCGALYRAYLQKQTSAPDEAMIRTVLRTRRIDEELMARVWCPSGRMFAYFQQDAHI